MSPNIAKSMKLAVGLETKCLQKRQETKLRIHHFKQLKQVDVGNAKCLSQIGTKSPDLKFTPVPAKGHFFSHVCYCSQMNVRFPLQCFINC